MSTEKDPNSDIGCLLIPAFVIGSYCSWAFLFPIRESMALQKDLECWNAWFVGLVAIPLAAGARRLYRQRR